MHVSIRMISGLKRWMTSKAGASLSAILITAIGGAIAVKLTDVDRWEIWSFLIKKEPAGIPVVLSPRLQYDKESNVSARVRIALEKLGVRYRTIDRVFPVLPSVVPSDEVATMVIEQGERLLDQHGGDVIVYGSVGTSVGQAFLRLFVKSDCDCVHGATPFDLNSDDWQMMLKLMIEAVMTKGLGTQYRAGKWINSRIPLSKSIRVWEEKFGKLANLIQDDILKEEASDLARQAKLTRIKIEGDRSGIRELRQKSRNRFSAELSICKNDKSKCRIRRELLFLADLEIYDGLMNGLPERIEEGLSLALLAGRETMDREILSDPAVLRAPMQSGFEHWLSMANLILACDDQMAMRRFIFHLKTYLKNNKRLIGFRKGDVERMLWPMSVLRNGDISKTSLEDQYRFLSQHPYFGWSEPDNWQDPFLHAKRSIRRRLERLDLERSAALDSRFMGQLQCPSLLKWMRHKGW